MSTNTILATTPLVSTNYLLRATGTTIGNSLIFDNGTNVGIGNTNTSYTLDVSGTGRFTSAALNTIQLTNTGVAHGMTGWAPTNTVGSLGSYDASGNFAIMGFSSSASQNGLSLFGFIGVTDPTDSVAAILLNAGKKSGTGQAALGASETTFQLVNGGIGSQITVLGSGNVGIGTSSPSEKLHLYNNTAGTPTTLIIENNVNNQNSQINFKSIYGGSTAKSFLIGSNISVAAGSWEIYDATAAAARLVITSGGVVQITGLTSNGTVSTQSSNGSLYVSSDANLKIEDGYVENGLEKVLALKPRYFYWKDKEAFSADRQLGFYAQEVNAVSEETANTPPEGCGWGIYDRGLVALLTAAIQELSKQNEELSNRLIKLELK